MTNPTHPGVVAWSGHNPGIYLKNDPDGEWTGLATFFRIDYSPFGMGRGVLLLDRPAVAAGLPEVCNVMISDNEALARYLMDGFFSKFAAFKVSPGTAAVTHLALTRCRSAGDSRSRYQEIITSSELEVVMTWEGLGTPYAVDMPAEKGPTGRHEMYSLFLDAEQASVTVNGRALEGKVAYRGFDGGRKRSAFLAFSETWVEMPASGG
ncbi:hypothetical protein FOZ76_14930 [Verticiella sediminum]|uniref:Uncharacterized protein n=1 Tax=Verticiella sediminum TaxID=1247510 RepID=A0A556AIK6_9BURK|nr:hypothetical protein [Verticiella sediminum]TSH92707.1 hypothetical protein FOZ76_14930 [Verticiella sediminum]